MARVKGHPRPALHLDEDQNTIGDLIDPFCRSMVLEEAQEVPRHTSHPEQNRATRANRFLIPRLAAGQRAPTLQPRYRSRRRSGYSLVTIQYNLRPCGRKSRLVLSEMRSWIYLSTDQTLWLLTKAISPPDHTAARNAFLDSCSVGCSSPPWISLQAPPASNAMKASRSVPPGG